MMGRMVSRLFLVICLSLAAVLSGACDKPGATGEAKHAFEHKHREHSQPGHAPEREHGERREHGAVGHDHKPSAVGHGHKPSAVGHDHKPSAVGHDHKPFEDVDKYIAFLNRAERAAWQKPEEVVAALKLSGDETVADIGAGSGYFSFRFADALPRGKVVAIDIEAEMIRHIRHRAMKRGVANIEAVLAKPDQPSVPGQTDVVFICDVLHHVPDRAAWLSRVFVEMKSGARLALIEFKPGKLAEGPPERLRIPKKEILALAEKTGFVLTADHEELLPYQSFLVFTKP